MPMKQSHSLEGNRMNELMDKLPEQYTRPAPVRVIAVASGKGGVGKTTVSVNLALALGMAGRRAVLLDADFGLANVDVMLGLQPRLNLSHVLAGACGLKDILLNAPFGVRIVPASSGTRRMAELSTAEHAGIISAFSELGPDTDTLIVDLAAGLSPSVLAFAQAAQQVLVVVCDEPASLTDAYALIKVLSREHGIHRFHVLANMVQNSREGSRLFAKLARVTERFLEAQLDYAGAIPLDGLLRRSLQMQKAVVEAYPTSSSALAFKKLAQHADTWPIPAGARGHLEFFVERLVGAQSRPASVLS